MPARLGDLTALASLDLSDNFLTGGIPARLGDLAALTALHLGDNFLTGGMPARLGDLTALTVLELHDNRLSGPIPAGLGHLTDLGELHIGDNHLTGCIPASLSDIAHNDLDTLGLPDCTSRAKCAGRPGCSWSCGYARWCLGRCDRVRRRAGSPRHRRGFR